MTSKGFNATWMWKPYRSYLVGENGWGAEGRMGGVVNRGNWNLGVESKTRPVELEGTRVEVVPTKNPIVLGAKYVALGECGSMLKGLCVSPLIN
jgi:hypothetical protein